MYMIYIYTYVYIYMYMYKQAGSRERLVPKRGDVAPPYPEREICLYISNMYMDI